MMSLDGMYDLESNIGAFQRLNGLFESDIRTTGVTFPTNPQNLRDSVWGRFQQEESRPPGANAAKASIALHQHSGQTRKSRNSSPGLRGGRLPRAVDTTDSWQQVIPAKKPVVS
jgi:hypothetical protein